MKTLIVFVGLLFVLIVIVGLYRGWFGVSYSDSETSDEVQVGVTIDKGKLKNDTRNVTEKSKQLAERAAEKVKNLVSERVEGLVVRFEPEERILVLRIDGELKTFHLDEGTEAGADLEAADVLFDPNDRVTITYRTEDGKHFVETIEHSSKVNS